MKTVLMQVNGMSCNHCVEAVKGALLELSGVSDVNVSLEEKKVTVTLSDDSADEGKLAEAIEDQGFEVVS